MNPSLFIQGLTALIKRLHPTHEKYKQIQDELNRSISGEHGEQHVYSLLKRLPENFTILHNVYIYGQQIDFLLLSPSFCVLLEVKNIKGKLRFTQNPRQLIRLNDDKVEDIFQSPESQLEQNVAAVQEFFKQQQIVIPVYSAIVFPFHNVSFLEVGNTPIFIGKDVLNFIKKISGHHPVMNPAKIGKLLCDHAKPLHRFPLCSFYKIHEKSILHGPECTNCHTIPMKRIRFTWICSTCGKTDQTAHIQALVDYRMLINETISVRELISFLGLRNRYEAIRILNKHSLEKLGKNRSTKYKLKI